jgi:uncharacterized damage-inducible protein DinB
VTDGGHERLTLAPSAADPQVGLLLAALADSRRRTMRELETVTDAMVGWVPPPPLNGIRQLLYHVALIEADWLLDDILDLDEEAWPAWAAEAFPIDVRDDAGRLSEIPPEPLGEAVARLERVRAHLDSSLRSMTDADLHAPRRKASYDVTPAWALHHLLQHEAEHRAHVALVRDLYLSSPAS